MSICIMDEAECMADGAVCTETAADAEIVDVNIVKWLLVADSVDAALKIEGCAHDYSVI